MIQRATTIIDTASRDEKRESSADRFGSIVDSRLRAPDLQLPCIWGLSVRQVHDAWWHARGVQPVRRGHAQALQRAAELYLLLEPDQLVHFSIGALSERLTWHNATVTRLRLVDGDERAYGEHVIVDDSGRVLRIERRYQPTMTGSTRVMLTSSRRVASLWMQATTRRSGWVRVRRAVAWPRIDHLRTSGLVTIAGDPTQERQLLDAIVESWPAPAQSIEGIHEVEPGVWTRIDESVDSDQVRIGPLWIGAGAGLATTQCLIGPGWCSDSPCIDPDSAQPPGEGAERLHAIDRSPKHAAIVRPIAQVELAPTKQTTEEPGSGATYRFIKRAIDIVAGLAALTLLAPVLALIAIAIVCEDGFPVLFGHRRQGRDGRSFRCWKFRTMHRNAELIAHELEQYNLCDGPQVFIRDDPRVTRVGRYLRKANLDELPQFFNVLVGHMSLVGPRPSPDDENQFCPAWRDSRLSVRPGITGLWQLMRKREPGEDFQEWIKYDIEYVQHASMRLDLEIIFRTAMMLLFSGKSGQ